MSGFLERYQRITSLPMGRWLFDRGIGLVAPFFATISPQVVTLEPGLCVVRMRDRRRVRNHLGTINAGALCTLAELTGGMATDASLPDELRWIPRAMTVAYRKKAVGTLTARCELDPATLGPGDMEAVVIVTDESGDDVFAATITFYVSQKKMR